MTENKIIGWLEAVSNRSTDRWMRNAVDGGPIRRPWMQSATISPKACMNYVYVLRALILICGFHIVLYALLEVIGLVSLYAVEATITKSLYKARFFDSLHSILETIRWFTGKMMPLYILLFCIQFVATVIWLLYRAYFWNRRARRLQATPTAAEPTIASPGVWPPAPRIS